MRAGHVSFQYGRGGPRSLSFTEQFIRTMKAKLIELLLSSPAGQTVRHALRLNEGKVFTEVLYLKSRHAPDGRSFCDVRACIARIGEDGTLSGEAVEVDFLCLETRALGFAHDDQQPELDAVEAALDIDLGYRFRIVCQGLTVKNVRSYNLSDEPR
jgi:hypothetical protein